MANKNRKKKQKTKTSEVNKKLDKISSNKSKKPIEFTSQELNIESNFIFYILLFSVLLSLTLFVFYFLRSIDTFSYLISFYSPEKILANFFITSFAFVIICLLVGLFYIDTFKKRLNIYTMIFFGLNGVIISLIVYPITSGYNPIINYPIIAIILFVVDIAVEITPIIIGYMVFKNNKS